jgi:drug/metabolite transporter (DMT)-like permease
MTAQRPEASTAAAPPRPGLVLLALLALYLIWGSTYLAIRIALGGFPPLLMAGSRFLLAGGALYLVLRARGAARPTARQWRAGAVVGTLLCAANGLVTVAEQRVTSSVTAVVIASVPLWTVLVAAAWRERPTGGEVAGILLGLTGVAVLQSGGELRGEPLGAFLLVASTWCWALGSIWSRRLPMPAGLMAPAAEMLAGGVVLTLAGLARGERLIEAPGGSAVGAWVYLVLFGSLIGFTAYNFLLRHVRPALATSYAYVNPAVAVALGAAAGEPVGGRALVALSLILLGVAVVAAVRRSTR